MSQSASYDVVVIGSGEAGLAAVFECARLGARTALIDIEDSSVGGRWLSGREFPLSVFAETARACRQMELAAQLAIDLTQPPEVIFAGLSRRTAAAISRARQSLREALQSAGIGFIAGRGYVASANSVAVLDPETGDERAIVETSSIIVATGAKSRLPEGFSHDDSNIVVPAKLFALRQRPKGLRVAGAGTFEVGLAAVYASFGVPTELAIGEGELLPGAPAEIRRFVAAELDQLRCSMRSDPPSPVPEEILLAIEAREPNTGQLGLLKLRIQAEAGGRLPVDRRMQTSAPNIFACGSCAAPSTADLTASQQGRLVARAALKSDLVGLPQARNVHYLPFPEAAWFGSEGGETRSFLPLPQSTEDRLKLFIEPDTNEIMGGFATGAGAADRLRALLLAHEFELGLQEFVAGSSTELMAISVMDRKDTN